MYVCQKLLKIGWRMSKLWAKTVGVFWDTVYVQYQTAPSYLRPKLHYTDTGYTDTLYNNTTNGHHQRTSSQQFYNNFATSQCQSPTSRHVSMLGCGKFLSVDGEFVVQQVVELLWARPLVVSVAGKMLYTTNLAGYGRVVQHLQLAVSLSVGAVRSWCPCSGVWH